jgi:tripartite-type tricarboxylate transporter receptor subunit TctC
MMRALFRLAFAATAFVAGVCVAQSTAAQSNYPSKPVRMVVPYPPAGPTDVIVRVISQRLAEELGQSVVVENRPGASGMIGAEQVARAAPDGYTLLVNPSIHVILPNLNSKMPYDAVKDFAHVTVLVDVPLFLVVDPKLPIRSVPELIAYTKANPGKLSFASSSSGSSSHLAGEQYKLFSGASEIVHIPYKGSAPALADLMGGQVQMMFDSAPSVMPFVKNGRVRAIGVTTAKRSRAAPDVPTLAEGGLAGFDHSNWYGLWGPRGMDRAIVNRLADAVSKVIQRPDVRDRLVELGAEPVSGISGDKFEAFAQSEMARFGNIVKRSNVKMD